MTIQDLGYNESLEKSRKEQNLDHFEIGRVIAEHKERYIVKTNTGDVDAEITGNMRYTARGREDFPAVGDWVALATYEDGVGIIHSILPRFSVLKRQAVGQFGEIQIIATNIDQAFIIQSVDRDFNINRIERYLTICHASRINPVIVLTKTDLVDEPGLTAIMNAIQARISDIPVMAISNETRTGYEAIHEIIRKGKTYCMLGSSGVGKSTLLNNLCGDTVMKTDTISRHTHKGKHVTTHRELTVLPGGGVLIDNPGMREVGIADTGDGLEMTFDNIAEVARHCKFKDCTHTHETGCAVFEAVERGEIDQHSYENYLKMLREKTHFESTVAEKRKKEKIFGKIIKDYYKKDIKQRK